MRWGRITRIISLWFLNVPLVINRIFSRAIWKKRVTSMHTIKNAVHAHFCHQHLCGRALNSLGGFLTRLVCATPFLLAPLSLFISFLSALYTFFSSYSFFLAFLSVSSNNLQWKHLFLLVVSLLFFWENPTFITDWCKNLSSRLWYSSSSTHSYFA